ncbi:vacuolating cytotoxin fragment 2 [Helicobacter acinonychis]|uniref:Vacuolating cytotoxin 2 n=2 Tax=Helicobacter acinonychis TaxID=212 RepID=Q17WH1_HELAH|nr:vacuolating cytotoxin fragment 2 [Helicobacter acinonychis str. Sheeba]SFZ70508.1 OMP502 [Helicobacter acinonychis]CAK00005.1 vacuolating cytotoxin vacA fragment 2 [Helicobacter acinonychis str. Sheeba]SFZ70895.1 OMP649 [Helicobacter acinonychis]STP03888.1 vacuolating cytotoxin fragment 2 [Helicobacter acinonychis]
MKNAVGAYNLSGLRNYTGGDLDANMQKAAWRLGQSNGSSSTNFKEAANRATRVNSNAKNVIIGNFLEIHNRMGSGARRKASSAILTLQSARRDCKR